jgi:hypothetical protein
MARHAINATSPARRSSRGEVAPEGHGGAAQADGAVALVE